MKKPSLIDRLRAKKALREDIALGVAWYTEEQWARVKASAADPENLEPTYPEWVTMAEEALKEIRRGVRYVEKIQINAGELAAWCMVHGKPNNSSSRAEFASHKMRERDGPV